MKQILQISLLAILSFGANAQDFLALSTGNYAGVTGVAMQPASIADNRYKFDINLFSTSLGFKSNFIGFDRSFAVANKFDLGSIDNFYDFRNKTLSKQVLATGVKGYANITNTFQIPVSFMLATGKQSAIALNMRSRTSFAMKNIPSGASDLFFNLQPNTTTIGSNFVADGLAMNGVSWLDIGLTYARVLVDENQHFLKAGVTGKYIGGISSFNFEADKLAATVIDANNVTLNSGTSYVKYSHSPTNFAVSADKYSPDASSFGFDAGIVYEFRGRISKFKLGKYADDGKLVTKVRRDKNKYTFRIGASIMDAGKMDFKSSTNARDFQINKTVNFPAFVNNITSVATFDSFVNAATTVKPGSTAATYSIAMPTALNLQLDLHLIKGLYVNGMINKPFTNLNSGTTYRTFTPEYIAVTPRWESRYLGLYVPILRNNQEKDWRIGTTLRLAGFFVGTNNLATLFKSTSINEADVHTGIKLPLGFGRPSKAFEKFNKIKAKVAPESASMIKVDTSDAEIMDVKVEDAKAIVPAVDNSNLEARLAEAEAKLKAALLSIEELEKKNNAKKSDNPATTPAKKTEEAQPVRIIINNYNSPNGGTPTQTIDVDGGVNNDIDELKRKIEQKEKMLEELKKIDKSTGCVDNKKKIASLKAAYQNTIVENAIAPSSNSVFASTKEMLAAVEAMKVNNNNINSNIDKEIALINSQMLTSKAGTEEYNCLLWKKNELLDLKLEGKQIRLASPKKEIFITKIEEVEIKKPEVTKVSNGTNPDYTRLLNEIEALRKEKATVIRVRDTVIIERVVEKPSIQYVDKERIVEKIVDRPVDRVVEKIVDRPVDRVIEKIIDRPVTVEKTVTKIEQLLSLPPDVVLFDIGKSNVKAQYFTRLTYYATQLKKFSELQVTLNGYTDNSGNAASNQRLSEARAKSVKTYLMSKGVKENQIVFNFAGADNPIAENNTAATKSQNRRVEISFNK
jgi:outer membrane protein OmpA-like peptidoglycan-associated protein/roadblock/LC7 domain-containing protein